MGSGLSAFEAARNFTTSDGERPLERCGISLETIEDWTFEDVNRAIDVTNKNAAPLLSPHIEKFGITGLMLLNMSESDIDEFCQRLKLDEPIVQWVTKTVLRLQKRHIIVGRDRRFGPLPEGWTEVVSRSRPGKISYKNDFTGAITKIRPKKPGVVQLEPLPIGWIQIPSTRWPGEKVYMHTNKPNMHLGFRPLPLDATILKDKEKTYQMTQGIRKALNLVGSSNPSSTLHKNPEKLLQPYKLTRKAHLRSASIATGKLIVDGQQQHNSPPTQNAGVVNKNGIIDKK
mmetsp:Transcript_25192/g.32767  ORF Transcript_25192/g.32767 Transcript_25192/m.32767 type:complete len:287 (-) Transcript_25192:41-901(-)